MCEATNRTSNNYWPYVSCSKVTWPQEFSALGVFFSCLFFFFFLSMAELVGEARGGWVLPTLTIVLCCLDSVNRLGNDNMFAGYTLLVTLCHFRECLRYCRAAPLWKWQLVNMSLLANCYSAEVQTLVASCSVFIHLLYMYLFTHVVTRRRVASVSSLPTLRAVLSDTFWILGPHSISLSFLLQGCPEGDVCCWCSYSDQRFAGLRGYHDKVCWLMLNHSHLLIILWLPEHIGLQKKIKKTKKKTMVIKRSFIKTCVHRFSYYNPAVI